MLNGACARVPTCVQRRQVGRPPQHSAAPKGLLEDAGWTVDDAGVLAQRRRATDGDRGPCGSSAGSATMDSIVETYTQNLRQLGIDAQNSKAH